MFACTICNGKALSETCGRVSVVRQRSGLDVGFSFSGPGFKFATPELQLRTNEVFRSGSEVFPASTVSEHFCSGNGSEQFGTVRVLPSSFFTRQTPH